MKSKLILPLLLLTAASFLVSLSTYQATTGPHGGKLKRAENYLIELKMFNADLYTYLLDQKLMPVGNKGISCEIKFFTPDSAYVNTVLKPFREDGFILESNTIVYQSCKVIFKVPGKSVSANFDNENVMVEKNK